MNGASISKQTGRYYELILDQNYLQSNETKTIILQLQTPRIGSYNLSCGPQGIFILNKEEEKINIKINEVSCVNFHFKKNSSTLMEFF